MSATWLIGERSRYVAACSGNGPDEPQEVLLLELVRTAGRERLQVGHAEVRGAGGEDVVARERVECGVAAGAAAGHRQARGVHVAARREEARGVDAVDGVDDAPIAAQPLPVGAAVPARATVVHVHHGDAT
jgi:hypothetical protein